ncbi:MAG: hypothetical protein E7442_02000 [Ruminococcaceae bacterium]|nr:hypothetical protein [Oscillospiraceae bacterium]
MKGFAPGYYPRFRCIGGECRHSCCVGWEIDIDEDTLDYYNRLPGDFGERLRAGIEGGSFRLDAQERCPFLNGQGLCDVILTLGEEALSQICSDHPRYRNFFSHREETGLGLCCEAAAELILGETGPFTEVLLWDDGVDDEGTDWEKHLLARRAELMAQVQEGRLAVAFPEKSGEEWREIFLSLERMDEAWTARLQRPWRAPGAELAKPLERLLLYFLYRHLPAAEDERSLRARTAFALLCCRVAGFLSRDYADLLETARLLSAEIEYSDENVDRLLKHLGG